ncbi:MAG: hypothetical protein QOK40_2851 [Miltoncostaeaceae bacterium]|nr:hypothetical protein [Miltoncostaeaceae bacterium]
MSTGATPPMITRSRMHRLHWTGSVDAEGFRASCEPLGLWYHAYYFDNDYERRGEYNIGIDIDAYGFPADMSGMRVLDIGTGAGWFSFFFEQQGAEVTTVDIRGHCDLDIFGRWEYPPVESEKPVPDRLGPAGEPIYHSPVSAPFWVMRELLGSRVEYLNGRTYEVRPELFGGRTFDLVFMGALLCHLRDPVGALMAARSVCSGRMIATTLFAPDHVDVGVPHMELPWTDLEQIAWWRPSRECFRRWFRAAGFRTIDADRTVMLTTDKPRPHVTVPNAVGNPTAELLLGDAWI